MLQYSLEWTVLLSIKFGVVFRSKRSFQISMSYFKSLHGSLWVYSLSPDALKHKTARFQNNKIKYTLEETITGVQTVNLGLKYLTF